MTYWETQQRIGRDTLVKTATRERFDLPVRSIEHDAKRVNKEYGPIVSRYTGYTVDEARSSVLRALDSAVSKMHTAEFGNLPDDYTIAEVQALMLLAVVNETKQALTAIWRDESNDWDTATRLESNALCRMRRAEHKYAGRALNLRDYI